MSSANHVTAGIGLDQIASADLRALSSSTLSATSGLATGGSASQPRLARKITNYVFSSGSVKKTPLLENDDCEAESPNGARGSVRKPAFAQYPYNSKNETPHTPPTTPAKEASPRNTKQGRPRWLWPALLLAVLVLAAGALIVHDVVVRKRRADEDSAPEADQRGLQDEGARLGLDDPTEQPTGTPTPSPSRAPTKAPTQSPSRAPTGYPTHLPTPSPSRAPTKAPTQNPSRAPTGFPTTLSPSRAPTRFPTTLSPSRAPTDAPTEYPTTLSPSRAPTDAPTWAPTNTPSPTPRPTPNPTPQPTPAPIVTCTFTNSFNPYWTRSVNGRTYMQDGSVVTIPVGTTVDYKLFSSSFLPAHTACDPDSLTQVCESDGTLKTPICLEEEFIGQGICASSKSVGVRVGPNPATHTDRMVPGWQRAGFTEGQWTNYHEQCREDAIRYKYVHNGVTYYARGFAYADTGRFKGSCFIFPDLPADVDSALGGSHNCIISNPACPNTQQWQQGWWSLTKYSSSVTPTEYNPIDMVNVVPGSMLGTYAADYKCYAFKGRN